VARHFGYLHREGGHLSDYLPFRKNEGAADATTRTCGESGFPPSAG
jgi:hypothetical protein